uniref:Uncharacterized protein n=1 Tax=Arion vulgaris TaxID=1028688 RepID=A0A0B7A5F9_9EUPU
MLLYVNVAETYLTGMDYTTLGIRHHTVNSFFFSQIRFCLTSSGQDESSRIGPCVHFINRIVDYDQIS